MKTKVSKIGLFLSISFLLGGCAILVPSVPTSKESSSSESSAVTSDIPTTQTSEESVTTQTEIPTSGSEISPVTSDIPSSSLEPTTSIVPTSSIEPITSLTSETSGQSSTSVTPSSTSAAPTSSIQPTSPTNTSSLSPSGYYDACEGLSGSALQSKLLDINPVKNDSYDWSRYEQADESETDPSCILSLYTRHNIPKSNHCGNYAWDKWNREHIWTQSAFPRSDEDNHNIFACEGQINGYRGNLKFAEGGETVVVFGHTTGCKKTSSSFEPCDEAKGEVARSVMYGTVMYTYTMTDEIQSIALALKWHLEHPITSREIRRNEVVYKNQGNRNPFVDHPEYACRIWGNTDGTTRSLCGM